MSDKNNKDWIRHLYDFNLVTNLIAYVVKIKEQNLYLVYYFSITNISNVSYIKK